MQTIWGEKVNSEILSNQNFHKTNFHFFRFSVDCMGSIFYRYILMLIKQDKDNSNSI